MALFVESETGEEGKALRESISYSPSLEPGGAKSLRLYADSNVPSVFLILPVDRKTRDVSEKWNPVLVRSEDRFSEIVYPGPEEEGIPFRQDTSIDLFVSRIPLSYSKLGELTKGFEDLERIKKAEDKQLFLLRSAQIRGTVERWFQNQNRESCVVQYRPPAKAATQRSGSALSILWREEHLSQRFLIPNEEFPWVVRIPVIQEPPSSAN